MTVEELTGAPAPRARVVVRTGRSARESAAELRRWWSRAAAAAVAALLATSVLAWQLSEPPPSNEVATAAATRDRVLIAASDAVEVLNTLDHRDVEAGLQAWESVTTGALAEQISGIGRRQSAALSSVRAVSTARVVEAAVTDLDVDAGSATVIAFAEVTVTKSGKGHQARHRYAVDLRNVGGRWLVAQMTPMELER